LYTADGQEIVGAILPTDKCEVEYIPSETGKDIIKVKFEEKDSKGTIRLENPRFVERVLNLLPVNGVYIGNGYGKSNIWRKDAALIKYLNDTAKASDKKNIEIEAKKTYSSFLLSLRTISARIPSQSFQSFLSNETVAFTEDLQNNGYMNIWEMWFQGSDYDIDKAYTLIFGLDGSGQIPGHALMDYTSPDTLFKSLILQNPDKNLEIYTGGGTSGDTEHKFVDFEQMLTAVGITKDVLLEIAGVTKE
jgi:hypothetical protein